MAGIDEHAFRTLQVERRGHVLWITIDHPSSPVNAVDATLHHEFAALFSLLKQEGEARAAVLTARGDAFSAGGDMRWFPTLRSPEALHRLRREAKQIVWDQLDVEIPIVCGLNGHAVGLGASIALLCDVLAGDGGAAIWPLLVGPLAAKRHLMLGDPLTASAAVASGVAVEACAADAVAERSAHWAERLARQAPLAVQGTKIAVNAQVKQALLTSFDLSTALELNCFLSDDHAEAVDAFVEKRPPTFHAR